MNLGGGIPSFHLVPVPVPQKRQDLKFVHLLPLNFLNQVTVDVQLSFPICLTVHHRPDTGELVICNHHPLGGVLLKINLP